MFKKILVFSLLSIILVWPAARAADPDPLAMQDQSPQLIKKIDVTFPLPVSVNEPAPDELINKLTAMEQARFVYLDLSINFSSSKDGSRPYSLLKNGKPVDDASKGCDIGPLLMAAGVSYELGPIANYNHLLMSILTGDRSAFPYNDVSCQYVASGNHEQFQVRGFFHVIANSIPTAVSLQLRPFNPPFELARKVLTGE